MKKIVLKLDDKIKIKQQSKIEKQLKKYKNIKSCNLDLKTNLLTIHYNNLSIDKIYEIVEKNDLKIKSIEMIPSVPKLSKKPVVIFGIICLITIYIVIANNFKLPIFSIFNRNNYLRYGITMSSLTTIYLIYFSDILIDGTKKLLKGRYNLNTLATISIMIPYFYSLYQVFLVLVNKNKSINNVYFELLIITIYIIKISNLIENKNKRIIDQEIKASSKTKVEKVNIKENDSIKEVHISELKDGDIVYCLPSDKVVEDGIIVEGESYFDESIIKGESKKQLKTVNSRVYQESINCDKEVYYKVDKNNSSKKNIYELLIEANSIKKEERKIIDKVPLYIIPIIMIISVIVLIIKVMITNDLSSSIDTFVKLILIVNPCCLFFAQALSSKKILDITDKKGLVIKKIEKLEECRDVQVVIFDKTATLTDGYKGINRFNTHCDLEEKKLLEIVESICRNSINPLSRGISKYLKRAKVRGNYSFNIEDIDEYSVKANDNDNIYYICNSSLLEKLDVTNSYKEEERKMKKDGCEVLYLVRNKKVLTTLGLRDMPRPEAKRTIELLKEMKKEIIMLSGDNEEITSKLAKELNITTYQYGLSPKEKYDIVKSFEEKHIKVMYVGEGLNDAPSLLLSTIGISLKKSKDIVKSVSDGILLNNNLLKIINLFNSSKNIIHNRKQTIISSLLFMIFLQIISFDIIKTIKFNELLFLLIVLINIILIIINTIRLKKC